MPAPYRSQVYDSPGTGRMSDLIRTRGDIAARRALTGGQAAASALEGVGRAVGGTMADLARLELDKPRREAEQIRLVEAKREASKRQKIESLAQFAGEGKLDPTETADLFEREGLRDEADRIRQTHHERVIQAAREQELAYAQADRRLTDAQDLYSSVLLAPDPATKAEAYARVRPEMAKLLPGPLAEKLPETWTPDLDTAVQTLGMKLSDAARLRAGLIQQARELAESQRKDTKTALDWFGKALRTVEGPEEYQQARGMAKFLGASEDVLQGFGLGRDYDPEVVKRAANVLGGEKAEGFTLGRNQVRFDRDGKVLARGPAGPEAGDSEGRITPASRATAERWKADELQKAEAEFSKVFYARPSDGPNEAYTPTAADKKKALERLNARKEQIMRSYEAQVGATRKMSDLAAPADEGRAFDERQMGGRTVWTPRESAPPAFAQEPTPASTPTPAADPRIGTIRMLRDGRKGRIVGVNPDGSLDLELVP